MQSLAKNSIKSLLGKFYGGSVLTFHFGILLGTCILTLSILLQVFTLSFEEENLSVLVTVIMSHFLSAERLCRQMVA